jgi:hypothetical protein
MYASSRQSALLRPRSAGTWRQASCHTLTAPGHPTLKRPHSASSLLLLQASPPRKAAVLRSSVSFAGSSRSAIRGGSEGQTREMAYSPSRPACTPSTPVRPHGRDGRSPFSTGGPTSIELTYKGQQAARIISWSAGHQPVRTMAAKANLLHLQPSTVAPHHVSSQVGPSLDPTGSWRWSEAKDLRLHDGVTDRNLLTSLDLHGRPLIPARRALVPRSLPSRDKPTNKTKMGLVETFCEHRGGGGASSPAQGPARQQQRATLAMAGRGTPVARRCVVPSPADAAGARPCSSCSASSPRSTASSARPRELFG